METKDGIILQGAVPVCFVWLPFNSDSQVDHRRRASHLGCFGSRDACEIMLILFLLFLVWITSGERLCCVSSAPCRRRASSIWRHDDAVSLSFHVRVRGVALAPGSRVYLRAQGSPEAHLRTTPRKEGASNVMRQGYSTLLGILLAQRLLADGTKCAM